MTVFTDLTLVLREGMIGHPAHGRTPVRLAGTLDHAMYRHMDRRNPYDGERLSFANEQWVLNGNTGTHMDSVWHADPTSEFTADRMPVERGYGPAIWLDCSAVKGPGAEVTPDVLEEAEHRAGTVVEPGDIVLVHTGWSENVDSDPDAYLTRHMGLTRAAGEWLRGRGVTTVGIDNATVETVAGDLQAPVHMNFLRPRSLGLHAGDFIAIIENLVHIDRIPSPRFTFVGMPLPFEGGSGSPIRAVALTQ
ncbi:cyclase family protein [Blastococcus sp. URHD0036]|uniref:cyclase family protein n=1 Tax=Blastococcus sp. URHD0036 TaxID=1380356 RepID=UPI0004961253|nr:cyclase family protein [Blastococcus sp. URHD0036]